MSESQLLEVIERYLNGEMSQDERIRFEALRRENNSVEHYVAEHQQFMGLLKQYAERVELENRLNAIHQEIDVHTLKESLMEHPSWIVQLWRNHHSKISVAATIALFAVVSVMYFTGSFKNNNQQYAELVNKVNKLDSKNAGITKSLDDIKKKTHIDSYSGTATGFAVTSNGLIVTNYHVVRDADSIHVQNANGRSFKAKTISVDAQNDIAILKITDDSFEGLGIIPYTIRRGESDLAETISTYGYPEGRPAYLSGYLSSLSGVRKGDSIHYQISTPINYGNSGGPLWDSKGNVIGITDAKQAQAEGEHFAIKSKYLLDALRNIPADSLDEKINLNRKNTLSHLSEVQRVKKEKEYVFMVKTYGN